MKFTFMLTNAVKEVLAFTVPGDPVPCPRPRVATRGGRSITYMPGDYQNAKDKVTVYALTATRKRPGEFPIEGPVLLGIRFFLLRGKTVGREFPTVKPDIENLSKTVMDALSGVIYHDDAQVVGMLGWPQHGKFYVEDTEGPRTEVAVAVPVPE